MFDIWLSYFPQLILLLLARVLAVFLVFDIMGFSRLSPTFRLMMALTVALALLPAVPGGWVTAARELTTMPAMVVALLGEMLLGVAIGLVCQMALGACRIAGYVAGFSNSLLMAQTVNPLTGKSSPITSDMFQLVFMLMFFLMNGHLVLIHLLAGSFRDLPVAAMASSCETFGGLVLLGQGMFEWGLKLSMPILAVALIIDVSMGLAGKLAPDFEIMFLSLPIRLFLGITLLGMVIAYGGDAFARVLEEMFKRLAAVLGAA